MFFLLNNYDSFVYNLASYFKELGEDIIVKRADDVSLPEIEAMQPEGIIISPGPKRPSDAKQSLQFVKEFQGKIPILGVCLGHQVISYYYGAEVGKGQKPIHGKVTSILHNGCGVFNNIPNKFQATRYHSLVVVAHSLPDTLQIDAYTDDGEVMGVSHREYPVYGVQFHPEAVLTEYGQDLLKNFINICRVGRSKDENSKRVS